VPLVEVDLSETTTPEEAEAALLSACRAGDRSAIRALYDGHVRDVMRTARRLGLPPSEIEDVAQEVFTVAFREIQKVEPGRLSAWLFRLTSNRVNDRHRRRRVRDTFAKLFPTSVEPPDETDPERVLLQRDAEGRVARILARMTRKKREVFVLFEIEGLPGEEIAERVGAPIDTVWTRLYHARREFARIGRSLEVLEEARSMRGHS
jgi:RNA polymerase sigma-70 factor (ECF subfamily)